MAKSIEEVLGKSINTTKELRAEIIRLQESIGTLGTNEEALKDTKEKLVFAQTELNKVTAAGKQATDFAKDSILGMEKEYKNLYNTYKMLTEEQRNSDFGKEMAASLDTLSNKLNDTKKGVGNFKDNIGRYSQGVVDAFGQMGISLGALQGPMKLAAGGAKTLGTALKGLIANPVGAIIMAIVVALKALGAIFGKVKEAIKGNEETQMRLNEAMANFQPIINAINNAFDWLAQKIVKVVEVGAKMVGWLLSLGKNGKEAVNVTKDIAKSTNELIKRRREYQELNANDKITVEQLREQAAGTTDLEEKARLLTEAKEIQAKIDERNLELAQENLRILELEASLTANDAVMNDKLAQAKIAVAEATAALSSNARLFTKQITSATKSVTSHTSALDKEKEALNKLLEEIEDNDKTELQKLTEKYEKEKKLLEKYHKDTTKLTEQYNKNVQKINDDAAREAAAKEAEWKERGINVFKDYDPAKYLADKTADAEEVFLGYKANFDALTAVLESKGIDKLSEKANTLWAKLGEGLVPPEAIRNASDAATVLAELALKYKAARDEEDAWYMSQITESNTLKANAEAAKAIYEANKMGDDQTLERKQAILAAEDLLRQTKLDNLTLELSQLELTEDQKLQLETEYYNTLNEIQEVAHQREMERMELEKERWTSLYNNSLNFNDSIGSLAQGFTTLLNAEIKEGNLSEKEIKKKKKNLEALQKVQTATAIISVIGDTASGIMGVWRGYAMEKVANAETAAASGPAAAAVLAALNAKSLISAIIQTAGLAATAAGQLAAIKGNHISAMADIKDSDSGQATATAVAPTQIDSNPYTYTRTLQTEEEEEALNRPVVVSVTDIEDVQNRVRTREEESTF